MATCNCNCQITGYCRCSNRSDRVTGDPFKAARDALAYASGAVRPAYVAHMLPVTNNRNISMSTDMMMIASMYCQYIHTRTPARMF